jgi:hypothetical protein
MNTMPLPVFVDRPHCYNREVASVGTLLYFWYIHDSLFPSWVYISLVCLHVIFLVMRPLGIKKRNLNSANKSKAATMKYETLNCSNEC